MYVGVPIEVPATVSVPPDTTVRDAEMAFAIPKSVTVALPAASSTLSGLMSRCTTPFACANARARATSRRMLITSPMVSGPCARRARTDSPSTYGIENQGSPSASPAPSTGTMCGCCSRAASSTSRLNRSTETPASSSGASTLITTLRLSVRSVAI